jgi:hypothetical protein
MAIPIRSAPTLKGKEARIFIKEAEKAYEKRHTIDMTKQMEVYKAIMRKAKI